MYSDISKRTSDFSLPNKNSARRRATSVLPTPVGPRNRKQPTGRPGALSPARLRRIARDDSGAGVVELQTLANDAQIFFFFAFFLGIEARLLEFVIGDGGFHAVGRSEEHTS